MAEWQGMAEGYILIAEDDSDINQMLAELLSGNGYRVVQAYSGTEALLHMKVHVPAAVILDLMLPGMAGEEVLRQIKEEHPDTAVLVISAKDGVGHRISLLQAGADDYLTKPFDTGELLARLEAVLRRSWRREAGSRQPGTDGDRQGTYGQQELETWREPGIQREAAGKCLRHRDLVMYPENYTVFLGEEELSLTRREFLILELLMGNPKKVFTKNNIYESVWNEEFLGEDNAVNVHISNLRQKLARVRPGESYIQTVWGIGFKMQ